MKPLSRRLKYVFLGISACPVVSSWSYDVTVDSVQYIISDSHTAASKRYF